MFFDQKNRAVKKQDKTKRHKKRADVGGGCNECLDVKKNICAGESSILDTNVT